MKKKPPEDMLHQHWIHSHEEDTESEMVFRPADFKFPPSRGRKGFELRADAVLIETGIGPTDRPLETQGKWKLENAGHLTFYSTPRSEPTKVMEISSVDKDRLVIKK
jgi:hypothetical protein